MINQVLNKYLINNFQTIQFEIDGTIINTSNSNLLNVTLKTKIEDLHPFFYIIQTLIESKTKEDYFEAVRFEDYNITADVIFNLGDAKQVPFIIIVEKTDYYNNIQAITQIKNEASIESQKTKLLFDTLTNEGKLKNEFLASITHDLKTPIHSIVNLLDLLNKNNLTNEQKKLCDIIHNSSSHLNRLINDVYDLASIETNSFTTKEHEFSLTNLLENLEKIYLRKTVNSTVDFIVDINNNVPDILLGDSNRLLQILINLLDNSFKYTQEGSVQLIIQKVYKKALSIGLNFIVLDTGSGLDLAGEKLSSKFKKNRNVNIEGLGLGISIVNSIVEQLNGTVTFKSELNKGTKFEIYLPFKLKSKKLPSKKIKPFKIKKLKRKYNVLIVDDNEINTLILMKLLINHGNFYLDIAPNSKQVMEMIAENSYDLILLDLYMPELNGFELIDLIKNHENKDINSLHIIPMSARIRNNKETFFAKHNITTSLNKPFTREELYTEIYKIL